MASKTTQAIVLRRTNFGEADRILTLLTPLGQRTVIAKGVRREKSKLAGGIELFGLSDITYIEGKGDMGTLTSARLVDFYRHILEDYDRLQCAYETINLVARVSRDMDEAGWFDMLSEILRALNNKHVPMKLTETWLYLRYAELMGEQLNLATDIAGNILAPDKFYMYDATEKGLRLAEQGDIGADHIKFLRLMAVKPLSAVAQVGGIDDILPECWMITRQHASI